jgi:UDP-N-acetylmuramyl pentapeptide phosphotransferase/UDP-N-acetylglucosamine-1-phosphate transferase
MNYILILSLPIGIYLINFIFKRKSFLLNYTGEKHQKFTIKEKIPLSGGSVLLGSYFLIFNNFDPILSVCLIMIFCLGLFSDLKIIISPKIRFLFQLLIIFAFAFFLKLEINNTRVIFLDAMIKNNFFSYFFVIFCVLILVNGTNFIDGLNTNVLGYYLIVSVFLYFQNLHTLLEIDKFQWINWIYCLAIIYVFNFFKNLFIGDNGAYLISLFYSFLVIKIFSINPNISPFYIVLLLWYPCFEILFSIIRKIKFNRSPLHPDNKHFHQILFILIKKNMKIKNIDFNSLSAQIINFYNLAIIFLGSLDIYNSQYQILLILVNIFLYIFIYLRILNKINKN